MPAFIFFIFFFMSICLDIEASNGTCTTTKCSSGAPEIRFPFEKGGQLPQHCDHPGYLLDFKNNTTIIHFPSYGHLVVKSISYDIEKLNLVDPKNCIHEVFLNLNLSLTPFQYYYAVKEHTYLNCSVTLSPSHSEIPCLSGPGYHVYAMDPSLAVPDSCRVVKTVDIPLEYSHYLSDNSFGLELTWGVVGQEYCEAIERECSLQPETEQETECLNMTTHEKDGGCRILPSTTIQRRIIEWDQGWNYMEKGIAKLKSIMEGLPETQFSSEEYMMLYTTIYNMCTQDPPYDYSQQLYDKFRETFEEFITSTVLPSLRDKQDEILLQEFAKSWENHKVMVRWLSRFFHYLDRYFISQKSLPPMNEVGHNCFRDLVYREISVKARVIVIGFINKEREGEQMDRTLLKNAINIYVEIGMGKMDAYEEDFEAHMLTSTGEYYSRKAASWIVENSCQEYMSKADECLIKEKARVSDYLHSSSEEKLVQKVEHDLLLVYANQLTEKEGCRKPVSAEGSILVQLAEDVA